MNDKWLRVMLIIIPSGLFLFSRFDAGISNIFVSTTYLLTVIIMCEGSRRLIYKSFTWFSGANKKAKRLAALIPCGILFVTLLFIINKSLGIYDSAMDSKNAHPGFTLHINENKITLGLIGSSIVNGILSFSFLLGVFELAYHFARLRHSEIARDRLEREKLRAELQQLKGIINPHFLFNNLNSLSSLISENPAEAEDFLDELTKVFRYLLRNNETDLTTLAQELQFMNSYYKLLQTRYGKAISVQVDINPVCESYLLPPLTLQLLLENAVKHNRVHKEEPLHIELFNDETNRLVVRNNLLPREHSLESTGIGLRSINSRYKLLNHEAPTVKKDASFFSIAIPLIPPADLSPTAFPKVLSGATMANLI